MKKHPLLRIVIVLCLAVVAALSTVCLVQAAEEFTTRLKIDHKVYIDEALQHALKERPDLKATNLSFDSLSYQYQQMDGTISVCDATGCRIVPAAPFSETLSVNFTVLDSKRLVEKDGGKFIEHDLVCVQFPTPRKDQWYVMKGTSSSAAPAEKQ